MREFASRACFLAALTSTALAGLPNYTSEAIIAGNGVATTGLDINERGEVVGMSTFNDFDIVQTFPWHWTPAQGAIQVVSPADAPSLFMRAEAINNRGQIVGRYFQTAPMPIVPLGTVGSPLPDPLGWYVPFLATGHAVEWLGNGVEPLELPTLGPKLGLRNDQSVVESLNDAGVMVGMSNDGGQSRAMVIHPDGGVEDLSGLLGGAGWLAFAVDITEDGTILTQGVVDGASRAVVAHPNGELVQLPVLIESEFLQHIYPVAMNEQGQVTGIAEVILVVGDLDGVPIVEIEMHGFLWSAATGMIDLGNFTPIQMNNLGDVVGFIAVPAPFGVEPRAALWRDGELFNLDDHLDTPQAAYLARATDINDAGQIVGIAWVPDTIWTTQMTFVYTPNPAPGDFDADGDVDLADLGVLLAAYGVNDAGDIDGDGDTDLTDLGALLANYQG